MTNGWHPRTSVPSVIWSGGGWNEEGSWMIYCKWFYTWKLQSLRPLIGWKVKYSGILFSDAGLKKTWSWYFLSEDFEDFMSWRLKFCLISFNTFFSNVFNLFLGPAQCTNVEKEMLIRHQFSWPHCYIFRRHFFFYFPVHVYLCIYQWRHFLPNTEMGVFHHIEVETNFQKSYSLKSISLKTAKYFPMLMQGGNFQIVTYFLVCDRILLRLEKNKRGHSNICTNSWSFEHCWNCLTTSSQLLDNTTCSTLTRSDTNSTWITFTCNNYNICIYTDFLSFTHFLLQSPPIIRHFLQWTNDEFLSYQLSSTWLHTLSWGSWTYLQRQLPTWISNLCYRSTSELRLKHVVLRAISESYPGFELNERYNLHDGEHA